MNSIKRRAQIEHAGAKRVHRTADHVDRQLATLLTLPLDHLCGWSPIRPLALVGDLVGSGPAEPILAYANAIAPCHAAGQNEIEILLRRIDDDRAGRIPRIILHFLRQEAWIERQVRIILRPAPDDLRRLIMLVDLL